jgi:hypothetical protein
MYIPSSFFLESRSYPFFSNFKALSTHLTGMSGNGGGVFPRMKRNFLNPGFPMPISRVLT